MLKKSKSLFALCLMLILSLSIATGAFAASSASIVVEKWTNNVTAPVDGQGQYGRVTLASYVGSGTANIQIKEPGSTTWRSPTFSDPDFLFLQTPENGGTATTSFWMSRGHQYRLQVWGDNGVTAGYIYNY
ncbi:hypothetical protein [Paenibacillus sp. DR312]|uniref:hypothetical protein n=1 Tax=unclassified Paenibacillus TaxID=185978 RepID=UPI001C93B393|nr:hypothetical protein [Paenibacillus sp. DR312]QZN77390.1 hypothetical protein K5K90_09420 [Paenibacillus sp. DR312]